MFWWFFLPLLIFFLVAGMRRPAAASSGRGLRGARGELRSSERFTIGTYNIQTGKGVDGNRFIPRTADVLRPVDIAGLQEVLAQGFAGGKSQAQSIGERLDMGWLYAPAETRFGTDHRGNGLVSKLPVGDWQVTPLAGTERKGYRSLLRAEVSLEPDETFTLFVTHLSKHQDHDAQLDVVLDEFQQCSSAVLVGDLNTRLAELETRLDEGTQVARVDDRDDERIDWILVRGFEIEGADRVDSDASDHALLTATLRRSPPRGNL